jgi:hypothetical protein
MTRTYDPLREITDLPRMRMKAIRPPAMGTALVLERSTGAPVVVSAGEPVPDAWSGKYRRMYVVDVATRALSFTEQVLSQDPAFPFSVTVSFGCQVDDPVLVARDNVRDMTASLRASLSSIVRTAAARFDVLHTAAAEAAITDMLDDARPPLAVRLSGFAVTVTAVDASEILTASGELRVQKMRRDAMLPVAEGGRNELLAQVMALTGGDPTPLLDREETARANSTQASLDALRALMGSTAPQEDFTNSRISEYAMNTFFPGGPPLSPSREGLRGRIERRNQGAIGGRVVEEGPAEESPVPPGAGTSVDAAAVDAAEAKPEQRRRSGRLRGTAATPTSDED